MVSPIRAAVLTISTSRAAGEAEDLGGPALAAWAESIGATVVLRELISDDEAAIAARLRSIADEALAELILTTGGTGLAGSDRTPEATAAVIERPVPGIAEAMRLASRQFTSNWMLSRGLAGCRGAALIVNFPGSPKAIGQAGAAIAAALPHAIALLAGGADGH